MIGKKLFAVSPLKNTSIEVEVISSHYVDHEGKRKDHKNDILFKFNSC